MKDIFTKNWIIENSIEVVSQYEDGMLTLRGLHYQLVGLGMTNDIQHYKRVVSAMESARWDGLIRFEAFSDLDRTMIGITASEITNVYEKIDEAKEQVKLWIHSYRKNKWENQPYYPEVLIEKKALQKIFEGPCKRWKVSIGACKGYPSLTFLHDMSERLREAEQNGKEPIILYFGDYDPSGEDIPRSIQENLKRFLGFEVELRRIALSEDQVKEWRLPHAPVKQSDSRTANWDGLGQVELDAVKPEKLIELCDSAISDLFDEQLFDELEEQEETEAVVFRRSLKDFINEMND